MYAVRVWLVTLALAAPAALRAQQPTPPNTAEQGKPTSKPAAPAAQRAPKTRADTARALREPLDTVRVDAAPAGKPTEDLAVEPGPPWRTSYFPYISGSGGDILLAAKFRPWLPAAFEDRVTYRAALSIDAGYGLHGSWMLGARFDAPLLKPGWRGAFAVMASRENRFGFYGFGNNSEYDRSMQDSTQPNLFRVRRTRVQGYADVSRRLYSRLYIAGRIAVERADFDALDGPTVFQTQYGGKVEQNDLNGRVALVFDSRNNEYNTRQGLLLEAGVQAGSGGTGYNRVYTMLRGFVPLRASTVVAARFGASDLHGTPTFNARFDLPTWETPMSVYGGYNSNRGFGGGRFVGTGLLMGSLEVRQDFLPFGEIAAGTLVAFIDAGRVFENETFTVNGNDLHVAVGIGIAARLLRSTIFAFNIAKTGEGWRMSGGSGWAF